jgi:hypothetical protein
MGGDAVINARLADLGERVDSHAERIAALYDMVAGQAQESGDYCEAEGCSCRGVDETDMRVMQTLVERLTATVKTLEASLAEKELLLSQAETALMNVADQAHPWGQHLVGADD